MKDVKQTLNGFIDYSSPKPVSYTHLDVYKRQTLMNIALCATALCLNGKFGDMPDNIEEP